MFCLTDEQTYPEYKQKHPNKQLKIQNQMWTKEMEVGLFIETMGNHVHAPDEQAEYMIEILAKKEELCK